MSMERADFAKFFAAVNDGHSPFAWQERLLDTLLENGRWPDRIAAPTGAGKTSAIDVHVFAVALTTTTGGPRLPRRLAMVVGRRVLVDNQHEHAQALAQALAEPRDDLIAEVARRLAALRWLDGLGDGLPPAGRFDLELGRPVSALSRGNRQKVGLVQAFMHRPEVAVLDEPTTGLDPASRARVHQIIRALAAGGAITAIQIESGFLKSGVIQLGAIVASYVEPDLDDPGAAFTQPAGGAIVLRWREGLAGFTDFATETFPEYEDLFVAGLQWQQRRGPLVPAGKAGRSPMVIDEKTGYQDRLGDCAEEATWRFLRRLGIETRAGDPKPCKQVAALADADTRAAVNAERALLAELEGGCQVPVGAWARFEDGGFVIDSCVVAPDGSEYIRLSARATAEEMQDRRTALRLGRELGRRLIEAGADRILRLLGRTP